MTLKRELFILEAVNVTLARPRHTCKDNIKMDF
jgi:hypothetical protein